MLATVLGEVTGTGRLEVDWHGERVVDVPPRTVAHEGPVYTRPLARPADQDALVADGPGPAAATRRPDDLRALLLRMVASPGLCSRAWVTDQYDRYVQGNTVLAQPEDAGVVRIDEATGRGVALATDGNGRYTRLDPYAGRAARARRGVPERGRDRRRADRGDQLPQLRQPRGPGGDVAVRRGRARAGRRLPRSSAPR